MSERDDAVKEVIQILDKVCDGKPVSLTAGRCRYLVEQLLMLWKAAQK